MALVVEDGSVNWLASDGAREEVDIAALVERHGALLYRLAFSVVRSSAEAEDVVQETFLRAVQKRNQLAGVLELRAWLVRVAWNLALDRKRRITPKQLENDAAAIVDASELPADRRIAAIAELANVLASMDKLPKVERAVLLLSAVEELSTREIAAVIGRSESGVRALLFRARAHLEQRRARERKTALAEVKRRTR